MHSLLLSASRGDICSSLLGREEGIHVKELWCPGCHPHLLLPCPAGCLPTPQHVRAGDEEPGSPALRSHTPGGGGLLPGPVRVKLEPVARGKQGPDVTILSRSRSRSHLQVWSPFPVPGSEADHPGEAGGPMLPVWVVPPVASESP